MVCNKLFFFKGSVNWDEAILSCNKTVFKGCRYVFVVVNYSKGFGNVISFEIRCGYCYFVLNKYIWGQTMLFCSKDVYIG